MADTALNAAVRLLGPAAGHELLGCDWGTKVATTDDRGVCTRQARQRMALHNGDETLEVQVCNVHRARLYAETEPHEAVSDGR